ncbi:MAG: hypothetical protein IPL73_06145 [Candidatus Obscuribacter sp.]|nr:hypothetical protein [Candidatus Obscuribacter sp.]
MDSVIDNSGKRVIAENVTQNIQSTITPKSLPLSPANEVAVVRNANSDSREAVLARNSAPVVMASQLAVKDAGGQNKTEGQARNESPVRAEVLVKAEPVARVEPVTKLTENIKGSVPLPIGSDVPAAAQTGSKSDDPACRHWHKRHPARYPTCQHNLSTRAMLRACRHNLAIRQKVL